MSDHTLASQQVRTYIVKCLQDIQSAQSTADTSLEASPPLRVSTRTQEHAHFRRCPSVDSAAASDIGSYAISARAHACSTVYQARGVACSGRPRTLCLARHAVGRARSRKWKQSLLGFEGCLPTTSFSECRHPGPTRRRSDRVASLRCLYSMQSRLPAVVHLRVRLPSPLQVEPGTPTDDVSCRLRIITVNDVYAHPSVLRPSRRHGAGHHGPPSDAPLSVLIVLTGRTCGYT